MVSTRLMTIGSSSTGGSSSSSSATENKSCLVPSTSSDTGSSRVTRNSIAVYTGGASSSAEGAVQCNNGVQNSSVVQTVKFLDLPQEVIEKVFSFLPFKEICKVRLVSRRVDEICGYILNSTFTKLQNQMLQRFQEIKSKMPRRESARRSHHLACESDIIETLHMRLTLLQMSFGKHIERKHCCFFPGEILDEVYSILYYIKTTQRLDLPYKVTDELFDLSTMAMEYFKEKIEPNLPEIAYFSTDFLNFSNNFPNSSSNKYCLETSSLSADQSQADHNDPDVLDGEEFVEIPQSNMVLRKRIRKIKQGMKRYNNQLTVLRQELKTCKKKTADQQKQITDQQKQLADQQKQTLEYATRLDEYDKKNEEISRKFSTLLQELNKCKTELQYWRCKSPATPPVCTSCGSLVLSQPEELQALANQGVNPEVLDPISESSESQAIAEQKSTTKSTDPESGVGQSAKDNIEATAAIKEKMVEPVISSPGPASRGSKRKSSTEERCGEDVTTNNKKVKRTRRLSKVRSTRNMAKI